jgi:GTP cyclohydrolase I
MGAQQSGAYRRWPQKEEIWSETMLNNAFDWAFNATGGNEALHTAQSLRSTQAGAIEDAIRQLLRWSGADLNDPHLAETPQRAAHAYTNELLKGYRMNVQDILKTFDEASDEPVLVRRIPFHSLCAHHILPFFGTASVVYKPDRRVLGLSKIGRLVDCLARRLQIQERLTSQIADALHTHLAPKAAVVLVRAEHMCMSMRGIRHFGSETVTCAVRGNSETDITECRSLMEMICGEPVQSTEGMIYDAANRS